MVILLPPSIGLSQARSVKVAGYTYKSKHGSRKVNNLTPSFMRFYFNLVKVDLGNNGGFFALFLQGLFAILIITIIDWDFLGEADNSRYLGPVDMYFLWGTRKKWEVDNIDAKINVEHQLKLAAQHDFYFFWI